MTRLFFYAVFCMVLVQLFSGHVFALEGENEPGRPAIGVILPFSSAFGDIALEQQKAMDLALNQTGHKVDLIYQDGGPDRDSAVKAFKRLVKNHDEIKAVISCSSWASDAIHPLAAGQNLFHIAIGSADIDRTYPGHTVRFTLDAGQEEEQLAQYLDSFDSMAVLAMDNNLGRRWINMISRHFQKRMAAGHVYDPEKVNIETAIEDIRGRKPEALVLISAANAGIIAENVRLAGIDAQLVGTRPVQRPALLEKAEYTEGIVYTYPSYNLDHPFLKDYEETYGQEPGFFAVEAFEALNTLIQALDQGNEKPKLLFDWYAGNVFVGALGRVKFRDNGDATYPYLYKTVADGRFKVAEFQFPMLLQRVKQELDQVFNRMDAGLAEASEKLSSTGLNGPESENILQQLFEDTPHAYNCVTVDKDGIIVSVAPDRYKEVLGQDISSQEQILRLHKTRRPVLSRAIPMVEGFVSIDLEHPVFSPDGEFTGSVSILVRPDFFGSIIDPRVYNFPVEIFVLQKDGTIIYDINEEEMGRNAFEDPMYADFPSVAETARSMVREKTGQGRYRFKDRYLKETVEKNIIWTTVGLHGTEYRLALTWSGTEADMDYQ